MKTSVNLAGLGQFLEVLTVKIFIDYDSISIIECVVTLDNGDNIGILDVASFSLARKYSSNSNFPNLHIDTAASINGRHLVSCLHQFNLDCRSLPMHYSRCGLLPRPKNVISHKCKSLIAKSDFLQFAKVSTQERFPPYTGLLGKCLTLVPFCTQINIKNEGYTVYARTPSFPLATIRLSNNHQVKRYKLRLHFLHQHVGVEAMKSHEHINAMQIRSAHICNWVLECAFK